MNIKYNRMMKRKMLFAWALAIVVGACGQIKDTDFELRMEAGDERRVEVELPDRSIVMHFTEEDTARRAAFPMTNSVHCIPERHSHSERDDHLKAVERNLAFRICLLRLASPFC